jgi:glyoxalase family protein
MTMSGIHHVTAISGRAYRNLDFYTGTLGMRFVKKTVNFDDPGTYHLYYGDEVGHPGTILTFFSWEHASAGRSGVGFAHQTAFCVPANSLGYWTHRFIEKGVPHEALEKCFGEPVLAFTDPDGMRLALVGVAEAETGWSNGDVPAELAIRGFHGVTLLLNDVAATGAILADVLGFAKAGTEGAISRYRAKGAGTGAVVDLHEAKEFLRGAMGRGSVHHIAFRAKDDAAQAEMATQLRDKHGLQPTEQKDRQYFRSVYFREPGGILFEIATDDPGFTVDESATTLGTDLKLPPFLEPRRKEIEAELPPLQEAARNAPGLQHRVL